MGSTDKESEDNVAIMKKQMAKQASKSSSEPQAATSTSSASASRSGSSESSTIMQGSEGASDSVGTTHDNPITNLDAQDSSTDVDHPRSPSRSFSPWPVTVEPLDSRGPSTIAKGKHKQDAVPLERSVSPLTDIAEDTSQVNMKKRKKSKTLTAEKATGSRKSTWYRK